MRKRILSIVVALAMVLTMMPQIAAPTSAKERKTTEKSKVANATEFMSIEEFDEDAQIVSGGYYIFSANIIILLSILPNICLVQVL